jgi:hypothetical protein
VPMHWQELKMMCSLCVYTMLWAIWQYGDAVGCEYVWVKRTDIKCKDW